ncbi:MAG: formate/nitrite transporter family protein [Acetobacteraceae bacterium]
MSDSTDHAAGAASPHLARSERRQAAEHTALRPLVIHEIIREEGETELVRSSGALLLSGFAAGLSMGFSFLAEALLHAGLPDAPFRHLIESFGYSIGFIIVILGRQQLFTERTLTAVLQLLTRRNHATASAIARVWGLVLAANLFGTWCFAALLLPSGVVGPDVAAAFATLAGAAIPSAFVATLLKSVFAGWLIALMVWLLPSAHFSRLSIVLIITYVVALARLSHIVAGSTEAAYAVLTGLHGFGAYVVDFLAPTLIGNTIGGVALVALLNHGSIVSELAEEARGQ